MFWLLSWAVLRFCPGGLYDDVNDPYQLHSLSPAEHPELFASLCGELAVLLRDHDDVWYRERVLSGVLPYDTEH